MTRSLACCLLLSLAAAAGAAENAFFVQLISEPERAILAHRDGSILLLGLPDLDTVGRIGSGGAGPLEGVAVSASGRWLAADFPGRGLEVRDVASGDLRMTVPRAEAKTAPIFLFEPRRELLLVFQGEELQVWDAERGARAGEIGSIRHAERMSVSPDGLFLAVAGWCRSGCGDYDLCVYGLEDDLLLAGGYYDALLEEADSREIHDLAYMSDNRILVESRVPGQGPDPVARMLPATLRVRGTPVRPSAHGASYPGIRSAPRPQYVDTSLDGLWKVRLSPERNRLYLYRRQATEGPDSEFELEKFVRLP